MEFLNNMWYAVLVSEEVKPGKLLGVKRLGKELVFFRDDSGHVVCLEDRCSHRSVKLSIGKINEHGCAVCPFHGFEFNGQGECKKIPANGRNSLVSKRFNINSYPCFEMAGVIYLYNGKDPADKPTYFSNIDDSFECITSSHLWDVHYSRAIENQLDVIHLPFVHKSTIGRGGKTLVNGPKVELDEGNMTIYVFNQVDEGQVPLKASEMTDIDKYFTLMFKMPNTWQNNISDKLKIVALFVPVDEQSTLVYLRTYHKLVKVPGLRKLTSIGLDRFNRKVLAEDYAVVRTQRPISTHGKLDEKLIAGDLPIGNYRNLVRIASQQDD